MRPFSECLNRRARAYGVTYSEGGAERSWPIQKVVQEDRFLHFYHYTTQRAAFHILHSKTIWASDAIFLNDTQEIAWGREALLQAFRRLPSDSKRHAPLRRAIELLSTTKAEDGRELSGRLRQRAYTASFSTLDDDLSQWRAYGGANGVALGFTPKLLSEVTPDAMLAPVIYGKTETLGRILFEDFNYILDESEHWEFSKEEYERPREERLRIAFIERYALFLPLMKHPKFKSEREWRLVVPETQIEDRSCAEWREGAQYAVPFLKLSLWKGGKATSLKRDSGENLEGEARQKEPWKDCRVVLGPGANPLARHFFETRRVTCDVSKAPYRSS